MTTWLLAQPAWIIFLFWLATLLCAVTIVGSICDCVTQVAAAKYLASMCNDFAEEEGVV